MLFLVISLTIILLISLVIFLLIISTNLMNRIEKAVDFLKEYNNVKITNTELRKRFLMNQIFKILSGDNILCKPYFLNYTDINQNEDDSEIDYDV